MTTTYTATGVLTDGTTLKLDQPLPVTTGRVRVVVEPIPDLTSYEKVMQEIRDGQRARGHVPPTREEVDAYLKAERDSWDDD